MDDAPPDRQLAGESSRADALGPAAVHRAIRSPQRDSPRADLPRVRFPLTGAELVNDGVESFDELADAGSLTLAKEDPWGLWRVSLTQAGHARYGQLSTPPRHAVLLIPDSQFLIKTPTGRRSNRPVPAPGGQSDPSPLAGESRVGQLRWAHCPGDGGLHLLQPADVTVATTGGHAEALCDQTLPAEELTLPHGSAGALCLTCIADIPSSSNDPGPRNPRMGDRRG